MFSERLFKDGMLTINEAHKILLPQYKNIMLCIHKGINRVRELRQKEPEYYMSLKPRTIANMVHDNIELMAKEIFKGKGQDIAVYTKKGFLIINFYGRIFLRFKKLQNCLMPCNIQTEQQRAFDEQTLFEGHITHLSAGYRLNDIGEYKDAHIVCVAYRKLQWNLKLPEVKEAITRNSDLVTSDQPIVVVRKSASKKLGEAS